MEKWCVKCISHIRVYADDQVYKTQTSSCIIRVPNMSPHQDQNT